MQTERNFVTGSYYHVFNRGVAKQTLFHNDGDYRRFLETLSFYLEASPINRLSIAKKNPKFDATLLDEPQCSLVEIVAYCLMPNHFHLIVRQMIDNGLSTYTRRAFNSYTRYYNTRYDRVGTAFQGTFQAVLINSDEQLLHVTRYVHLNPFVAKLVDIPVDFPWSSLNAYFRGMDWRLCHPSLVLQLAGSSSAYKEFVHDYAEYAQTLSDLKKHLIDE